MTIQTSRNYSMFAKLIVSVLLGQLIKNVHAIQGGHDVDSETFAARFPWVVGLRHGPGSRSTCTGVLVSSTLVLTARHCKHYLYNPTHVVLDTPKNLPFEGTFRRIKAFHEAPTDDYMLVEMVEPVQTTPLKLHHVPQHNRNDGATISSTDFELIALGFGQTTGNSWHGTTQLQQVAMRWACPHVRQELLMRGHAKGISTKCLVATTKSGQASLCHGDSGGPLVAIDKTHQQEPILVGILSSVATHWQYSWTIDRASVPMCWQLHVRYVSSAAVYKDANNILDRMEAKNAWITRTKECSWQCIHEHLLTTVGYYANQAIENYSKTAVEIFQAGASYAASFLMGGDTRVKVMKDEPNFLQHDHTQRK